MRYILFLLFLTGCSSEPSRKEILDSSYSRIKILEECKDFEFEIKRAAYFWENRCRGNLFNNDMGVITLHCKDLSFIKEKTKSETVIGYYVSGNDTPQQIYGGDIFYATDIAEIQFRALVPHELGHALGLEHISRDEDPLSIMTANVNTIADGIPSDNDIKNLIKIGWNCIGVSDKLINDNKLNYKSIYCEK